MKTKFFALILFPTILSLLGLIPEFANAADETVAVKDGNQVTIDYTGTLQDGTVFDSSKNHDTPLQFKVGEGMVIPGFEKAVKGMKIGEEKEFTLQPAEAYGEPNPKMIQKFPRNKFPEGGEPKVGMMMMMGGPNGQQMPAKITEVTTEHVTLDINHPLAGKALTFKIKLVAISH